MGPAGFLGLEDNEAIKFVQDGMQHVPGGQHLVKLDPAVAAGTSDSLISEASIRAMYQHWRAEIQPHDLRAPAGQRESRRATAHSGTDDNDIGTAGAGGVCRVHRLILSAGLPVPG